MAVDRLTRRYDGHGDDEIYERLLEELGPVANRYDLTVTRDDAGRVVSVARRGLTGKLAVGASAVDATLELSLLLRPIRRPVLSGIEEVLDRLFEA